MDENKNLLQQGLPVLDEDFDDIGLIKDIDFWEEIRLSL